MPKIDLPGRDRNKIDGKTVIPYKETEQEGAPMDDRARLRSDPDATRIQATPGAIPRRDFLIAAGVGVSNGWLEYTGLVRLPADVRRKLVGDIETLF